MATVILVLNQPVIALERTAATGIDICLEPGSTQAFGMNVLSEADIQRMLRQAQKDAEDHRWPPWTSWFKEHEIPVEIRPPANAPTPRAAAIRLHHGNRGDRRRRQAAVRIIAKRAV